MEKVLIAADRYDIKDNVEICEEKAYHINNAKKRQLSRLCCRQLEGRGGVCGFRLSSGTNGKSDEVCGW